MAPKPISLMIAALCASAFATASSQSADRRPKIQNRDNNWHLKCSNAPNHEGGYLLDPNAVPPLPEKLPQTGSDQQGMQFMWCTPGTATYTFFGSWYLSPPPLDYMNFTQAIHETALSFGNQKNVNVGGGGFTVDPAGTNAEVHMENAGGGTLTWGVANSALAGLYQFLTAYGNDSQNQNPMIFQVNDGEGGEVAIGYVAFLRPADGVCILQIYQDDGKTHEKWCRDLHDLIN